MYRKFFKRFVDIRLPGTALLILWLVLAVVAALLRRTLSSPVLTLQERPGKNENIFKMYKFRSMTDRRDENGDLLPDEIRLTKFGRLLRSTGLDELPGLWNIFRGDMSSVGPSPLLVKYLPLYNDEQRHRHDVRPGLTGLAQVNGRNAISWEDRFAYDVAYTRNVTFAGDVKILLLTVKKVFAREGISSETAATMEEFRGTPEEALYE